MLVNISHIGVFIATGVHPSSVNLYEYYTYSFPSVRNGRLCSKEVVHFFEDDVLTERSKTVANDVQLWSTKFKGI